MKEDCHLQNWYQTLMCRGIVDLKTWKIEKRRYNNQQAAENSGVWEAVQWTI